MMTFWRYYIVKEFIEILINYFQFVRNSIELIEEKDSLSVVERKNKQRLNEEIVSFVNSLQAVTDSHIETLKQANFSNPER